MKNEKSDTKGYLSIFSMRKLAKLSGVDYSRIYHVATGNRTEGFTKEENIKLSKTIIKEVNLALNKIGSFNRVTSIE